MCFPLESVSWEITSLSSTSSAALFPSSFSGPASMGGRQEQAEVACGALLPEVCQAGIALGAVALPWSLASQKFGGDVIMSPWMFWALALI